MKRPIFLFALVILFLSCDKDEETPHGNIIKVNKNIKACLEEDLTFDAYQPDAFGYIWGDVFSSNPDTVTNSKYKFSDTGLHYVKILKNTSIDSFAIYLYYCQPNLLFPTSFTPNGDGLNDYWSVLGDYIYEFHLWIYDSNNLLLYESTDYSPDRGWDGRYPLNGTYCPQGYYYYSVKSRTQYGEEQTNTGLFELLR